MSDIFGDWLATGTVRRIDVNLYADQAIMDEMAALVARREELENSPTTNQRAMGEKSAMAALERDEAALLERYEASKSTWTVRALTPVEIDEIREAHPAPSFPQMLPKAAPAAAKAKWEAELAAAKRADSEAAIERDLAFIAKAVVRVATAKGEADHVTVEQVRAMRNAEYGPQRIKKLVEAINAATTGEVEMPRPKSSNTSEATPA